MPRSQAAEKEPEIELESEKVIEFIRDYCFVPDGPNRGQQVPSVPLINLRGPWARPLFGYGAICLKTCKTNYSGRR